MIHTDGIPTIASGAGDTIEYDPDLPYDAETQRIKRDRLAADTERALNILKPITEGRLTELLDALTSADGTIQADPRTAAEYVFDNL